MKKVILIKPYEVTQSNSSTTSTTSFITDKVKNTINPSNIEKNKILNLGKKLLRL